jgi:hypothetical protein
MSPKGYDAGVIGRANVMTPQKFNSYSGLVSLVFKNIGWSAGVAILLASSNAFALHPNEASTVSQNQRTYDTTIAADVPSETKPQETKPNTQTFNESRFSCQMHNGQYTVMYHPLSEPEQSYAWATPSTLGGGWTQEKRCNEISRRLELYRPDGLLEMQTSVENNYNIICVTTQKDSDCKIVLTVPPGQEPQLTLNRVFENLTIADSGKETQGVNTFVGGNDGSRLLNQVLNRGLSALGIGKNAPNLADRINLRPFLDTADGGTGTQLGRGVQNRRLNPDKFR